VFAENSTGLSNPAELKKPVEMKGKKGYYMKISQITTIQYTQHVIAFLYHVTSKSFLSRIWGFPGQG
jgi:hypothetical protein